MFTLVHALRLKLHLCSVTLPGTVRASRPFTLCLSCQTEHIKKKGVNKKEGDKNKVASRGSQTPEPTPGRVTNNNSHKLCKWKACHDFTDLGCHLYKRLILYWTVNTPAKFMAVLAAVKWFCSENNFCTVGQTTCLALGQIFNLLPIVDKLVLMFKLTPHKINTMPYFLAQQSSKEYARKVITYSALSYFRQLPHVVRCWLEPVAVCADKASFMLRELAFMDSFFVGHQL